MKVLHILRADSGGAARAAIQQHLALLRSGVDSKMLLLERRNERTAQSYAYDGPYLPLFKNLLYRAGFYRGEDARFAKTSGRFHGRFEGVSFPGTPFDLVRNLHVQEADVLNLHSVARFIDYQTFFPRVGKPIVWTLHDMNPFSGIFHFSQDEERNPELSGVNRRALRTKLKSLRAAPALTIACPSRWIMESSQRSELFGRYYHEYIPYAVDLDVFRAHDRAFARNLFGLPANKVILLFVAAGIENRRKGLDILVDALAEVSETDNVALCAVGGCKTFSHERVINLGTIADDRLLSLAYSAANAVVIPSREDNLPNVMLEAFACGVPVVSFSIGGMRDFVRNGFNGIAVDEMSASAMAHAICRIGTGDCTFSPQAIRGFAEASFAPAQHAARFTKLYRQLPPEGCS